MKKHFIKGFCMALAATVMLSALAGCSGGDSDKDKGGSTSAKTDVSAYKGVDLVMYCAADDEETIKEVAKVAAENWENATGGKITYIMSPDWNQRYANLTVKTATGSQLDGYCSTTQDCPTLPLKGLFLPVDDYLEDTDYISEHLSTQAYSFNGKTYGFAQKCRSVPFVILYNNTLFKNNGEKTPMEYYKEGNWNWDTFRTVAKAMTQDLNNDGKTDQYGFGSWYLHPFICSAGLSDYIGSDNKLTFTDTKFTNTMNFLQEMGFNDKSILTSDPGNAFIEGKLAMCAERTYYVREYAAQGLEDDIDFVPFPLSSDNTSDTRYMYLVDGLSILSNTVNAEATAVFLKEYWAPAYADWYEQSQFSDEYWEGGYTDEQKQVIEDMIPYAVCMPSQGYPNFMDTVSSKLYNDIITKGLSVSSSVASYSPSLQAIIDDALSSEE